MAETTYTKLKDGSWGIRSTGPLASGQSVTVRKKDGTTKLETVGKVLWSGDGVTLATVVASSATTSTPRSGSRCSECGVNAASLRAPYEKILQNGLCSGCHSDRKAGYDD